MVLDDANAIELRNFTNDRFTGLASEQFDIVFWTDYTANRDVYEVCSAYSLRLLLEYDR